MVFQVNTAESTFGSNLYASVRTKLEGQDLQGIAKGTSDAKSLTWSFWVKGSVTGTYVCELYDNDNTRQASKTYTIDSANTWEKKTLTFEPDTTGDFDNDANLSLWVFFGLGSGSTYSSGTNSEGVWASAVSANRFAGQNNTFIGTSSATLRITGVQLELGETATPFEHRSFGDELIRCQRYYQKSYPYTNYAGDNLGAGAHGFIPIDSLDDVNIHFMQTMRATPSLTTYRKNGTATSSAQRADNAGSYITITVSEVRDNSFHFNPGSSVSRRYRLHYIADAEL
jgi:hypothetical protein